MGAKKIKTPKQMERHFKGLSNHYRIETLLLVSDRPSISLEDTAAAIGANDRTIGEHMRRLVAAGDLLAKNIAVMLWSILLHPTAKSLCVLLQSSKECK